MLNRDVRTAIQGLSTEKTRFLEPHQTNEMGDYMREIDIGRASFKLAEMGLTRREIAEALDCGLALADELVRRERESRC